VDGSNSANQFWIGGLKTVNRLKCDFGGKAITDSTDIADNKWNHIAVVYDKATRKLAFYRNWSLIGKATISADATIPEVSVNPIMLMGDTASAATTYTGLIDELRITKRALSVKEFLSPEHAKGFLIVIQ
jgi:hypothetical protein